MAILQLIFDGKVKQEYEINKNEFTIGRKSTNDIVIENKSISNHHAVIIRKGDDYILKDLESTNGTKLNGKKVNAKTLKHGDHIGLFKHTLSFVLLSVEEENIQADKKVSSYDDLVSSDETVMLNTSQINNLVPEYKSDGGDKESAGARIEVTTADNMTVYDIKERPIIIGRNEHCHIKTGGWIFTPAISAVIKKDLSGTYSIKPEATILINDKKVKTKQLLKNNDRILIRNISIIFRTH